LKQLQEQILFYSLYYDQHNCQSNFLSVVNDQPFLDYYCQHFDWGAHDILIDKYKAAISKVKQQVGDVGGSAMVSDFGVTGQHNSRRYDMDDDALAVDSTDKFFFVLPEEKRNFLHRNGQSIPRLHDGTLKEPYIQIVHNGLSDFSWAINADLPPSQWNWSNRVSPFGASRLANTVQNDEPGEFLREEFLGAHPDSLNL
jgi:hypothetical protein